MKQELIEKISTAVMNLLNDYNEDLRKYAENNIEFVLNDVANIAGITCADIDELLELEGMYQIVTIGIAYYYCGLSAAPGTCRERQYDQYYDRYHKLTSALHDQIEEVEYWLGDEGSECDHCDIDSECCGCCGEWSEENEKSEYVDLILGIMEALKDERVFNKVRDTVEYLSTADFV